MCFTEFLLSSGIQYKLLLRLLNCLFWLCNVTGGTLVLFDRKMLRNFRKDGHNWKKKKDGKTVKEAHEHLKVRFSQFLICLCSINLCICSSWLHFLIHANKYFDIRPHTYTHIYKHVLWHKAMRTRTHKHVHTFYVYVCMYPGSFN